MGIIKTKGIILQESNMGDYDKMVTLLTPDLGKIGCAAKGARRPKSTLMAGTQFLCFGDYIIYQGAGSYHINSCEPIEVFYNLRLDLDNLTIASQIARIVNDVTDENQQTYKILQLILNTMYVLSQTDKDRILVYSTFKMRLLSILGFMPKINACTNCNQKEDLVYFSLKDNGLKCKTCGKLDKSALALSDATIQAIKYIFLSPPKKLYSYSLNEDNIKELNLVSKLYLNDKLEREYK